MRLSPFSLRWFQYGVLGIISVTAVVVVIVALIDQHVVAAAAARDAATFVAPTTTVETQRVAAFIGDSYSAGAGSTQSSQRFTTRLAAAEGWIEQNEAYGGTGYGSSATENGAIACGQAVCPSYSGVIKQVVKLKPDIVVVSGGRNDVPTDSAKVQTSISSFFSNLHKALPNAKIYVTSPVWDDATPPAKLGQIAGWVENASKSIGATYLDIGEPLEGHRDLVAADGVHPNDEGHAAIATAIERVLPKGR